MNRRIRFIMPRLIGATIIAGMATLFITVLFKLLLGLTLLAGAATMIMRGISRRQKQFGHYGSMPGLGKQNGFSNNYYRNNSIQPIGGYQTQKGTTIVPVN